MFVWLRLVIASGLTFAVAYGATTWLLYPDPTPTGQDSNRTGATRAARSSSPSPETTTSGFEPEAGPEPATEPRVVSAEREPARFEKLDVHGLRLPTDAESWVCVRDNLFNLVWEVKQGNGAMRDLDFTYSWLSADTKTGSPDGGKCFYINCDTQGLIRAVNREGLCGRGDWRLPTNIELMTLYTEAWENAAGIDGRYFPHAKAGTYWSASVSGEGAASVWSFDFSSGLPEITKMDRSHHVRLVHSEP